MRAHPKSVVQESALVIQATVEHVRREFLRMACDSDYFIEIALVVAVNALGGRGW